MNITTIIICLKYILSPLVAPYGGKGGYKLADLQFFLFPQGFFSYSGQTVT